MQEDLLDLQERLHEASYKFWLRSGLGSHGDGIVLTSQPEYEEEVPATYGAYKVE